MGRKCAVIGCNNRKDQDQDDGKSLFTLNRLDREILLVILNHLGLDQDNFEKLPKKIYVCEDHFTADSLVRHGRHHRLSANPKVAGYGNDADSTEAKLTNSCRVCLATEERDLTDLSTDLFAIEGKETLALKLKLCCGIEPLKDDQLPQKICQICLEQLTTAWELRERCLATHALLRKVGTNVEDSQDIPIRDSDQESEQSLVEEYLEEYLEEAAPKASVQKPAACDLTCIFCEEVFETRSKKSSHYRANHSSELVCKGCNKTKLSVIRTANCMERHKLGIDRPAVLCNICGRLFKYNNRLVEHLKTTHAESRESLFMCDLCGVTIKSKANFQRHVQAVHLKNRFPCPHCQGVSYSTKQGLNSHLYGHHKVEAPVSCELCGAGFNFSSELNGHKRQCGKLSGAIALEIEGLSSDQIEMTCTDCDEEFPSCTIYRRHMKTVHGQLPRYNCRYPGCGKSFDVRIGLASHVNTHTGAKTFSCNLCHFRSGTRSIVYKHRKKMHT